MSMMEQIFRAPWQLVNPCHFDGSAWGALYKYPIYKGVPSGKSVLDGWGVPHKAPGREGTYTLWQFVQNGSLIRHEWEAEAGLT